MLVAGDKPSSKSRVHKTDRARSSAALRVFILNISEGHNTPVGEITIRLLEIMS